jgi:serine/threonine protein kinase
MSATNTTCPAEAVLSAFGLGKLDAANAESVSRHLETCADCQQRVAGLPGDSFVGRLRNADDAARPVKRERTYVPGESMANAANSTDGSSIKEDGPPGPSRSIADAQKHDGLGSPSSSKDGPGGPSSLSAPPELHNHPDYELIKELGQGGIGKVYLARNLLMDRLEVLKVVNPWVLEQAGALERFQQEIRAAARLNHPNIVAAYRVLHAHNLMGFAMEHIEGQDLARIVKRCGPLPVANAAYYTHQAALGLEHAFQKGMVHRDVKPGNLMLAIEEKKHVVKILDFGLAKATSKKEVADGLTESGQMLGTPEYAAPEQILDAQKADIRADIYSLGCTLYFLLSGAPPFGDTNLYQVLHAHQTRDARPLNDLRAEVPVELAAVVAKMMAKDPAARYQTPGEVAKALVPYFRAGAAPPLITPAQVKFASTSLLSHTAVTFVSNTRKLKTRPRTLRTIAAGAAAWLAILFGMVIVVRNPDGREVARVESPDSRTANAVSTEQPEAEELIAPGVPANDSRSASETVSKPPALTTSPTISPLRPGTSPTAAPADGQTPTPDSLAAASAADTPNRPPPKPVVPEEKDALDRWIKHVRDLPAEMQAEAVGKRLQELNPGFDGQVAPKVDGNVVIEIKFAADRVADITPVIALKDLKSLSCRGTAKQDQDGAHQARGLLSDLSALAGMRLVEFDCSGTQVADLSPLRGMPLQKLVCGQTQVTNLSSLRGIPLTSLVVDNTPVSDLSPLEGLPLTVLVCCDTKVTDLSPLRGMPLTVLNLKGTPIVDLSPLRDLPLTTLVCSFSKVKDLTPLRRKGLTSLCLCGAPVSDVSPLAEVPLRLLHLAKTEVVDISPLAGMPLQELTFDFKPGLNTDVLRSINSLAKINNKPAADFWSTLASESLKAGEAAGSDAP